MRLSIIIVTYNSAELIVNCLQSLSKGIRGIEQSEVIVVDNNSTDDTVVVVEKDFPQVLLIKNQLNVGFAQAVNLAVRKSKGDHILLLNPDVMVLDKAVFDSLVFMEGNEKIGILGCQLLNPDYSVQASFGNFPSLLTEFLRATFLYKLVPFGLHVTHNVFSRRWFKETLEPDWVSGGFMLVKRKVFQEIGLLDRKFFMYFEDVDFCRRACQVDIGIIYYPRARAIHHHMASSRSDFSVVVENTIRSLFYYFHKYKQDVRWLRRLVKGNLYAQIARYTIASLFVSKSKSKLKAYRQTLRRLDFKKL